MPAQTSPKTAPPLVSFAEKRAILIDLQARNRLRQANDLAPVDACRLARTECARRAGRACRMRLLPYLRAAYGRPPPIRGKVTPSSFYSRHADAWRHFDHAFDIARQRLFEDTGLTLPDETRQSWAGFLDLLATGEIARPARLEQTDHIKGETR